MLKSAEDNPLEYTLGEYDDAFLYTRLLLKVLDQVTGPSNPGIVSSLPLEQQPLDLLEASEYYSQDKTGVVTHYIITKLNEMIGLLLESRNKQIQISTLFYDPQTNKLLDDWRPLLRLLYRGGTGDAFSQRGAAMCLACILKSGCSDIKAVDAEETLQSLVSWLTSRLQSSHSVSLGVVTPTLVVLATCPPARLIFDRAGGIGYLTRHLRHFQHHQNSKAALMQQQLPQKLLRRSSSVSSSAKSNILTAPRSPGGTIQSSRLVNPPSTPSAGIGQPQKSRNSRNGRRRQSVPNLSEQTNSSNVQQLYELCFCLWTMSYDCHTDVNIRQHFHRDGAVPALAALLKTNRTREKVTRLALSSLRNLAQLESNNSNGIMVKLKRNTNSSSSSSFVQEMIGCGVHKSVKILLDRQWTDADIVDDLDKLNGILQDNFKDLSRWEVYMTEVDSGRLEWNDILHTSQFFKDNSRSFEGPNLDFEPLKKLIHILKANAANATIHINDDDDNGDDHYDTIAIACFDIGEFVRYYPNGKEIASRFGAKQLVMPLLDHPNQDVRRHALTCISKMLVNNWRVSSYGMMVIPFYLYTGFTFTHFFLYGDVTL